jgi:hypothetical protein
MKKVTSILMAFVLMLTLIPTAWAEGESAGTMPELKDSTYTLTEDVTIDKLTINANDTITLNLNGKKLTVNEDCGVFVQGELTVTGDGTITCAKTPIEVVGSDAKVTVENGKVISTGDYGIYAAEGGTIVVNGGEVKGLYGALSGNNTTGNMNFVVNGGVVMAEQGPAIYMPGQVELTVTGGTLNGGVSLRMGQVNISGGTFNAITTGIDMPTADVSGKPAYAYSGNVWFPDALYVIGGTYTSTDAQHGNSLNLNITGGTFNCTNDKGSAVAVYDLGKVAQKMSVTISGNVVMTNKATDRSAYQVLNLTDLEVTAPEAGYNNSEYIGKVSSSITGGTFNTNPKDYVPAAGYTVAKAASGLYTVSTKTVKEDGTGETTSAVKLEVPATSGDAAINTTVDRNDIETNKELTVTNTKTAVTINKEGVAAIGTGADLNLSIKADSKTPESANTAAYNKAMAGKDANSALVVNISLTSGTSKVFTTDVANAYALVTVPYTTDKADKLTVYYLNGSEATALTKVTDAAASGAALNTFSYDAVNKLITLKLPHFSEYLISTTATRSVVHHYGGTGTTTTTGTKTNSPTTFDAGVGIYAVSAILSVTGMAWVGTKQRKH